MTEQEQATAQRGPRPSEGWQSRALAARRVGRNLDEDVWDRVVALWRESSGAGEHASPALPSESAVAALQADVLAGRSLLLLVVDGPRLLGFAAVTTGAAQPQRPEVRQLHVRGGVPSAVVMTILLESALVVARERDEACPADRPATAAA